MRKILHVVIFISLSLTSAMAGAFEDKVDLAEAATALAQCSKDAAKLVENDQFIGTVEGKHTRISNRVDQKVIVFTAFATGGLGETKKVSQLTVTTTITQPSDGLMDNPAEVKVVGRLKAL